jgi:Transcription factor Tfb4
MEQSKSDDDNDPSILTLIVDTNPLAWKLRRQFGTDSMIDINDLIVQLLIFCHAYALMHRSNRIIVIANHPTESIVLYPRRKGDRNEENLENDDFIPSAHTLQTILSKGLLRCVNDDAESRNEKIVGESSLRSRAKEVSEGSSSLAQALSISLCGTSSNLYHPLYPLILCHHQGHAF